MKKLLLAACVVAFAIGVYAQHTVVTDELPVETYFTDEEQSYLGSFVNNPEYVVIHNDRNGHLICKDSLGKFLYVNVRFKNHPIICGADEVSFVDISGYEAMYGVKVKKGDSISVYTDEYDLIIPSTKADTLISVICNEFKSKRGKPWGYALFKKDNIYYTACTSGIIKKFNVERAYMGKNIVLGCRGDSIFCISPEGLDAEEFVFDKYSFDTQYAEVAVLDTVQHARYSYYGRKYGDITPGLLVRKGQHYTLYPGAQKLHVKKMDKGAFIGTVGNNKVFFSNFFNEAIHAQMTIIEFGY